MDINKKLQHFHNNEMADKAKAEIIKEFNRLETDNVNLRVANEGIRRQIVLLNENINELKAYKSRIQNTVSRFVQQFN